ncbi:Pimeloyl-ACP methyl ester carboxylesterase [Streptoalloteichus tenebrarius]|uniref:Pimeloyl-ACP methyl ester carboxylesterase n=1 Tax=Streptoalloteichus tenebrarius (strain ATCC 17920 / DSM 40477 / JCM 4838 / CBS 697.72 / NBRC 16177 / NCIMB 11028 / NRRL B-12390 / A12253. 1 / ISP 5477) TaxID=1933 RepID=A0ABT1HPR9_STRSD|nr:alpha/beta hydrolase [Streptoalloteichus tenebrarius]MCP2257505.1 Pimeloyl-ACP methyl ester carboxylesterase [Streptoalloteichus tenebrarius]BFE98455.1 alpha/beta hydrolase [Streptoalloteichus tenebrarius]
MSIYRSEAGARLLRTRYLNALERWPTDHERLQVPTPEGETFVLASGPADAPPLVLLHGSGSNSTQWMDRIPDLVRHFRVYCVDVIGEPGLSAPSRPPLDSDRYARWLDAVLDLLGVERVRIMGMSLGGWLALDYATRRPARVERLALSCPGGLGRQKKGFLLKAILLSPLGRWGQRRSVAGTLGPALSALPPAQAELVLDEVLRVSRNYRYRPAALPVFDDDTLRRLTMPVHVVVGDEDVMFDSLETKRRLETVVPHATVRLLRGIGHFVPAQTAAEIEFLTSTGQHGSRSRRGSDVRGF